MIEEDKFRNRLHLGFLVRVQRELACLPIFLSQLGQTMFRGIEAQQRFYCHFGAVVVDLRQGRSGVGDALTVKKIQARFFTFTGTGHHGELLGKIKRHNVLGWTARISLRGGIFALRVKILPVFAFHCIRIRQDVFLYPSGSMRRMQFEKLIEVSGADTLPGLLGKEMIA